jgi:Acetyltransferase (GNAT) domain
MELAQIERPSNWDQEIENFETKTLFHESAWLDFVQANRPDLEIEYFRILESGATVGYFCAFKKRKAMLSIYGSPFPGTGIAMGPVVSRTVDTRSLVKALLHLCREQGVSYLEMRNPLLQPEVMESLGFTAVTGAAQICPLPATETEAWKAMSSNCRQRIRRSESSHLVAELTTDPGAVKWFYAHYVQLLRSKGLTPDYSEQTPALLARHLLPKDRLFIVSVKYRGEVIATALYPHDQRCMYYWDGAYNPSYTQFSPNETLHWTAMKLAIARGIGSFHIGGEPAPSRFSQKFGGEAVPYYLYQKELLPMLERCRRAYQLWSASRERASLLFRRTFGRTDEAPAAIAKENSEGNFKPRLLAPSAPAIKT